MLTLENLMKDRLADKDFCQTFETECHICAVTVKIIDQVENSEINTEAFLKSTGIPRDQYNDLKQADCCRPELVQKLYQAMEIEPPEVFWRCPRR